MGVGQWGLTQGRWAKNQRVDLTGADFENLAQGSRANPKGRRVASGPLQTAQSWGFNGLVKKKAIPTLETAGNQRSE